MSVEKTKPAGTPVPLPKEQDAEQKKGSRPNVIERLADLQQASDALENLRKGSQNAGVAQGHTDHNDSHTDHTDHHSDRHIGNRKP